MVVESVAGIAAMELIAGCRDKREFQQAQRLLRGFRLRWPSEVDQERALTTYLPLHLAADIGLNDILVAQRGDVPALPAAAARRCRVGGPNVEKLSRSA